MPHNTLYQYSVVAGLMAGVASSGLPLQELLKHGDHGLGTFKGMQGELIIVDGEVWQMKHDGSVRRADTGPSGDITPFAMLLPFSSTASTTTRLASKSALNETLNTLLPDARNTHVAFKLKGTFNLTTRTAEGQCYPGEPLSGVASRQVNVTLEKCKGVVVGFRSPQFLQGVVVAGLHLHFIDDDRTAGGHVMEIEGVSEVHVEAAACWRTVMDLPSSEEFNKADLSVDNEGIQKVEG